MRDWIGGGAIRATGEEEGRHDRRDDPDAAARRSGYHGPAMARKDRHLDEAETASAPTTLANWQSLAMLLEHSPFEVTVVSNLVVRSCPVAC
jgi:hypothetical protein